MITGASNVFVVARGLSGRPTLIHRVAVIGAAHTGCGREMTGWSREYLSMQTVRALEILRCRQKGCR